MRKIWYLLTIIGLAFFLIAASPSIMIRKSTPQSAQGSIVSATNASGVTTGGWLYGCFIDSSGLTTSYTIDFYDHETGITVMATRILPSVVIQSGTSEPFQAWFDPPVSFNSGISTVVTYAGAIKQYQVYYILR